MAVWTRKASTLARRLAMRAAPLAALILPLIPRAALAAPAAVQRLPANRSWQDDSGVDGDSRDYFARERLDALSLSDRRAWSRYLASSRRLRAGDRAHMAAELRSVGSTQPSPAPSIKALRVTAEMTESWFRGAEAQRIADILLSYQTPAGGWSKHVDPTVHRRAPGENYTETATWHYIGTIDNDATTEQLRFLGAAQRARPDPRVARAFARGVDYLLEAQFPNGCWPQVFPLEGGYHDAATFNDDAILNVVRFLDDVAAGRFELASAERRRRAGASSARGLECILAAQVRRDGQLSVWPQQSDPLLLAPVPARSYELVGLAGQESAALTLYLMSLPAPSERVIAAVRAAVAWFDAHRISGFDYDMEQGLRRTTGGDAIWARLTDLGTDRPIFSNRDGIKLYDFAQLVDRRRGYRWFGKEPAAVLRRFEDWSREHP